MWQVLVETEFILYKKDDQQKGAYANGKPQYVDEREKFASSQRAKSNE
jgi:hypothetical protein